MTKPLDSMPEGFGPLVREATALAAEGAPIPDESETRSFVIGRAELHAEAAVPITLARARERNEASDEAFERGVAFGAAFWAAYNSLHRDL